MKTDGWRSEEQEWNEDLGNWINRRNGIKKKREGDLYTK